MGNGKFYPAKNFLNIEKLRQVFGLFPFISFTKWSDKKLLAFKVKAIFKQKQTSLKLFKNLNFFLLFWIIIFILYMHAKNDLVNFSW